MSEIAKGRNTRATTGDAQRPNMGMTSIASLNKQIAVFWAKNHVRLRSGRIRAHIDPLHLVCGITICQRHEKTVMATVDSSGAFLIGELERLDQTLNLPLVGYTWTRDIQLREDVSIADDISSWTNTSFAAAGTGANPNGKNWVGKDSTAIAGVNVDIGKSGNPSGRVAPAPR